MVPEDANGLQTLETRYVVRNTDDIIEDECLDDATCDTVNPSAITANTA